MSGYREAGGEGEELSWHRLVMETRHKPGTECCSTRLSSGRRSGRGLRIPRPGPLFANKCILLVLTNASLGPWCGPAGGQPVELPPSTPLLGAPGQLLLGSDGELVSFSSPTPNPAASLGLWGGGCPLWQAGSGLHTLPSPRHSCSPCAADREFTFILVTGLFSFS